MKAKKSIPTLLALFLILTAVTASLFLLRKGGTGFLGAAPQTIPQQIKVTNIDANSFTVSWITDQETVGLVKYGTSLSLTQTQTQTQTNLLHYLKIENLQPETKYYLKIGSSEKLYDQQGRPYEVATGPYLQTAAAADAAYGQVFQPDGTPSQEAIVYLTLAGASPLSGLSQADGHWTIPLSMARTADLTRYFDYDRTSASEEIFVQAGRWGEATVLVTSQNDSPVPEITLGQTYDFRRPALVQPTQPSGFRNSGFNLNPLNLNRPGISPLTILNPEEGEGINTLRPEFQGTGLQGETVTLILESSASFEVEVLIDENGQWHWVPPANLEPGVHTITITTADGAAVSREFTILAAGEADLPSFTATPSGQVSPTSTPSPTPTSVPRTSLPSTESGVPQSGYLTPTLLFVILGLSLIFSGLFLNFKFSP